MEKRNETDEQGIGEFAVENQARIAAESGGLEYELGVE